MLELCSADQAQLLIIDVQERLCAAMPTPCLSVLNNNLQRLTQAAQQLGVPIVASEQYPKGLGKTVPEVAAGFPSDHLLFEKTHFSCCAEPGFGEHLVPAEQRPQIVMAGIEAHICVLQTAASLQSWGYRVFVLADAVCSRNPANKDNALQRLIQAGIQVSNTESVVFEWLGSARHEQFKTLSLLFR